MGGTFDRDLERLLRAAGCVPVRDGKGSHAVWKNPGNGRVFVVPQGIVSRHTANAVLKQAGLGKGF